MHVAKQRADKKSSSKPQLTVLVGVTESINTFEMTPFCRDADDWTSKGDDVSAAAVLAPSDSLG